MKESIKEILNSIFGTNITEYDAISPTNLQEAEKEFLANPDLIEPNFKYEGVEKGVLPEAIQANLAKLEQIAQSVTDDTTLSSSERQLLELCIDDCWNRNSLVLSIFDYRERPNTENAQRVSKYNLACYCKDRAPIDRATFFAIIRWHMDKILPHQIEGDADRRMFIKLNNALSRFEWKKVPLNYIYRPKPAIMQCFAGLVKDHFSKFFRHIPEKEEFTAQEVCNLINGIIQTELPEKTRFQAVVDENRTSLSIDQIKRKIYIPLHRAKGPYDYETVKCTVVGHEFCVHAYRGIPFENSDIIPFYQGMPGYADFDEGLAKCVEQALKNEFEDAGLLSYVSIALAEITTDMDFRQIYEVILALDFLSNNVSKESDENYQKRLEKAQKLAFSRTYRALRGTNDLAYFKDLTYYNSTAMVWKYVSTHITHPDLMHDLFESGKTDPSNSTHLTLIKKYQNGEFN